MNALWIMRETCDFSSIVMEASKGCCVVWPDSGFERIVLTYIETF